MKMTALEMAHKYDWAQVTVSLNYGNGYCGHVIVEGRTRIVTSPTDEGSAVWVGALALKLDTMVYIKSDNGNGAEVSVNSFYQKADDVIPI
jgi:hypothetical protein